ncbi:MAG: hypothetical protein IJ870_02585 [Alphaproteobacteria bacterium]|nr:hypothetical protein [Alphaproteobacteria bacterium]
MVWDNDPMNKDVEEWDDNDAMSVVHSHDYQYNQSKQTKFNEYLNFRGYKQGY